MACIGPAPCNKYSVCRDTFLRPVFEVCTCILILFVTLPVACTIPLQCVILPSEKRPWNSLVRDIFTYGELPSTTDSRLIVDLRWFGMVEPCYENCVTFSKDPTNTDLFGMPQPTFHYSLTPDDTRRLQLMVEDMSKCAAALGKYLPGREPKVLPPGIAHHITVCAPFSV